MINSTQKEILQTLKRIESALWLQNGDERLKDLNKRLELQNGTTDEVWKRLKAIEKYFGVEFISENKYKKL